VFVAESLSPLLLCNFHLDIQYTT